MWASYAHNPHQQKYHIENRWHERTSKPRNSYCTSTQTRSRWLSPFLSLFLSLIRSSFVWKFHTNTNLSGKSHCIFFYPGLLILLDSQMHLFQHSLSSKAELPTLHTNCGNSIHLLEHHVISWCELVHTVCFVCGFVVFCGQRRAKTLPRTIDCTCHRIIVGIFPWLDD